MAVAGSRVSRDCVKSAGKFGSRGASSNVIPSSLALPIYIYIYIFLVHDVTRTKDLCTTIPKPWGDQLPLRRALLSSGYRITNGRRGNGFRHPIAFPPRS